jgi:acetyl-CoA synthetase
MMGPWLIYAALMNRATIALYDGAPSGRDFGEFVQDARVSLLGVVPSLVKTWRASKCMEGLDWSSIKAFSSTGECSNASDMHYLMYLANYAPVIEYCGGTEIGGGYITGTVVQPAVPAAFSTPALGLDLVVLDENDKPTPNGEVFLVPPSLGLSLRLLNRDHFETYYKDTPRDSSGRVLRRHGDQIEVMPGGYYRAHGRVDDTMNLGGIKVSSAEIERALNGAPGVRETAAIAVPPPGGGPSLLVVYFVADGASTLRIEELGPRLQERIRKELNPLFKISDLRRVDSLPRTASNKVMRRLLRDDYLKDRT